MPESILKVYQTPPKRERWRAKTRQGGLSSIWRHTISGAPPLAAPHQSPPKPTRAHQSPAPSASGTPGDISGFQSHRPEVRCRLWSSASAGPIGPSEQTGTSHGANLGEGDTPAGAAGVRIWQGLASLGEAPEGPAQLPSSWCMQDPPINGAKLKIQGGKKVVEKKI